MSVVVGRENRNEKRGVKIKGKDNEDTRREREKWREAMTGREKVANGLRRKERRMRMR